MTRDEMIQEIEELQEKLVSEVETDELCDYAREQTYGCLTSAVYYLEENNDPESHMNI